LDKIYYISGCDIRVIVVGNQKEAWMRDITTERIAKAGKNPKISLDDIEIKEENAPDGASEADETKSRHAEGRRILEKTDPQDFVIALAIDGRKLSPLETAGLIHDALERGKRRIVFVIGGSTGLSDEVLSRADYKLSFCDMTFPHQLARAVLSGHISEVSVFLR
jgi:23S rRNA (pseudouridine1915-N3)-methyltransferase